MSIISQLGTLGDWLFANAEDYELQLPYPRILEGDVLFDGEIGFIVLSIDDCPFVVCPKVWEDYGTDGQWAYVWCEETRQVAWVPLTRLYQLLEGQ